MDLYPHELGTCITTSMCMHQSHHPCCYTKSCLLDSEIFKSPKQSLGDLLCLETYCVCSDSSSFLTLNLFIAFLKDGQMEFYKTLGYDRPAYLVVHSV